MRLRWFLMMWAVLALVVGVTVVLADRLDLGGSGSDQVVSPGGDAPNEADASTTTSSPSAVPPSATSFTVSGTVTAVELTGAVLHPREISTPLTVVSDRGFGNGGELTSVLVEGRPSTIVWDGGRPFALVSGGWLVLDPVDVTLVAEGLRFALGGGAHSLAPGTYRLDTPVAVGANGIATPRDSISFEAVDGSLFEAHGDAALVLGPGAPHRVLGPGTVRLEGSLEVTDGAGVQQAAVLATEEASYDLTFTAGADGAWTVTGMVDGPRAS